MSRETRQPNIKCDNCGAKIDSESDARMAYCCGGEPKYICKKCNDVSGDFIFRRQFQKMIEKAEDSTENMPEGYWFCPYCKEAVDNHNVTFHELHESCGMQVKWIESNDDGELPIYSQAELDRRVAEAEKYKLAYEHLCANSYDHHTPYMICIPTDEWKKAEAILNAGGNDSD